MGSKQDILNAIRKHAPAPVELPDLHQQWTTYDNPQEHFAEVLKLVGGQCVLVKDTEALNSELSQIPAYKDAQKVCSVMPDVGTSNVDLAQVEDPHHLEDVDFAILPGEFCVAENAAIWVTDQELTHRAVAFLTQHLALVVPADQIVHNMHEAYQRLSFPDRGFGVFISGPSKTADIEQSLVIGAHGPRSLTVFLRENSQ